MEKQTRIRHKNPLKHVHYYQLRPWNPKDSYHYFDGQEYRDGYEAAFFCTGKSKNSIEFNNGFAEGSRDHRDQRMGR